MNDDGFHFQYTIPDYEPDLSWAANVAIASGSLSSRLVREERITVHPDGRPENVSEHSHMLAKVAYALACDMYPQLDRGRVVLFAILHDDVEAYVGDTPTHSITKRQRHEKKQREQRGLEKLVAEFTPLLPEYAVYMSLYENQEDAEARFVRVVDKIMTLLIHMADEGKTLRANWTFETLTWWTIDGANLLSAEYPEYEALVALRTEIAMYIARTYLLNRSDST